MHRALPASPMRRNVGFDTLSKCYDLGPSSRSFAPLAALLDWVDAVGAQLPNFRARSRASFNVQVSIEPRPNRAIARLRDTEIATMP